MDDSIRHLSPFEAIRRVAEDGSSYWSARDLAKILGYTEYNKFTKSIEKAKEACGNSGQAVEDHFAHMSEMIQIGKGGKRSFETVLLSRYACYLIVQNADSSKPLVALGQTYFAVQTHRQRLPISWLHFPKISFDSSGGIKCRFIIFSLLRPRSMPVSSKRRTLPSFRIMAMLASMEDSKPRIFMPASSSSQASAFWTL